MFALAAWIALVAGPAQAVQTPQVPTAQPPCRLHGTVEDAQTRAGVSGAVVALRGPAGAASASAEVEQATRRCADTCRTTADPDGRFSFEGLAAGTYAVTASVAGFSEPAPIAVTLAGDACDATLDIVYRFQMQTESRADLPKAPEATAISGAIAPVLSGQAIMTTPGALEDAGRGGSATP